MRARDNPFAAARVERLRYRLNEGGWDALLARLERNRWRGAIVGPHGSGKTTLLEELRTRLEVIGMRVTSVRLHAWRRALPPIDDAADVIVCDGAEQLSWLGALALRTVARGRGLIVTSHREGWLPTVHRCATSAELLAALVAELDTPLTPRDAAALFHSHAGNLRNALAALYDRSAVTGSVSSRSH
jgi:hypothetical protein